MIVSGDCCEKGKPDPQPFLVAAHTLNADPKECIVIEDAEAGILAGKSAGMKVIAVKSPNTHSQDLSQANAIVDSLMEVNLKLFNSL